MMIKNISILLFCFALLRCSARIFYTGTFYREIADGINTEETQTTIGKMVFSCAQTVSCTELVKGKDEKSYQPLKLHAKELEDISILVKSGPKARVLSSSTLDGLRVQKAVICERASRIVQCDTGSLLNVLYANYGRLSRFHCSVPNTKKATNCRAAASLKIVRAKCQGLNRCFLESNNSVFDDPCIYVAKYLEIEYTCIPDVLFADMRLRRSLGKMAGTFQRQ